VARQFQLANDVRAQQADDVGEDGELEAGIDLLGDAGAADEIALFQHQHLLAGFRQVSGGHQAVVPAADNNGVVLSGHRQFLC
jgi:hypothetical protein